MITYTVYKDYPFKYVVKRQRFWDKSYTGSINENTIMNVELEPYEALDITTEPNNSSYIINIGSGMLPNYLNFEGTRGILHSSGDYYLKVDKTTLFDTYGTPTFSDDGQNVTNFNANNYLQSYINLPQSFTFYTKFTVTVNASNKIAMSNQTTGASPVRSDSLTLKAWSSSQSFGTYSLTLNNTYWVKGVCDGTTYSLYGMPDTGQTLEEVKESDEWVLSGSGDQTKFFSIGNNQIILGRNTSSYTSQYWGGTIYLDATEFTDIWSPYGPGYDTLPGLFDSSDMTDTSSEKTYQAIGRNGKVTLSNTVPSVEDGPWVGEVTVPAHTPDTLYTKEYTETGDTLLNMQNLEMTFKANSYSYISQNPVDTENPTSNIRIFTRVFVGSDTSSWQTILRNNNNVYGIRNNKWYLDGTYSGVDVQANTCYWVKFEQKSNIGTLSWLVDDGTYSMTEIKFVPDSNWSSVSVERTFFNTSDIFSIGGGSSGTYSWRGFIDLKNVKIEELITGQTSQGEYFQGYGKFWTPFKIVT